MKKITTMQEANDILANNTKDELVVFKVGARWCAPCRMLEKTIEDIEPTLDNVKFYEIDVDEVDESFIEVYQIQNVPVLLFFNEGLQVEREVGNIPKSKFLELINNNI